jgi:hypothetical protein
MALRCETCGADNPATNRYCGQCGRRLERTASDTPEEFWRDADDEQPLKYAEASADLPPAVIDFDNQIPLIADIGMDRDLRPPPELVIEVHDHFEREAQLHDALQHGSEPHFEVHAKQQAERERVRDGLGEYLRWDANGNARVDEAAEPSAAQPAANQNFTFLAEGKRTAGTGVSGPSFLGLTDDHASEYADEEPEPGSHFRRNLALAILAAVIILAAVQWRSIRDYGLSYVQNGSMQVKQAVKGAPQNPPAVAVDHTSHDLALPPATGKAGAPVAVESSPNANRALPVQQASSPQPSQANPASASAQGTTKPPAMSNPVADVPKNEPPAMVSRSAAKPPPFRTPPSARSVSPASPVPGAGEMNRAASASDAEARAAWLWKAVGKGNPQAPIELANMYVRGNGVVRSCDQAEVLLRSAAAKGNEQARINLQQIRSRGGCSAR